MKRKQSNRRRNRPALSPEDYKKQRRTRRLGRSGRSEEQIRGWAEKQGCSLRVLNDGHHWLFQAAGIVAEWWPSSAKLAIDRDYTGTTHAAHWSDVKKVLETRFSGSPQLPLDGLFRFLPFCQARACLPLVYGTKSRETVTRHRSHTSRSF